MYSKTHRYKISELIPDPQNQYINYSTDYFSAEVTISYNYETGTLSASNRKYFNSSGSELTSGAVPTFTNDYTGPNAEIPIVVKKVLNNKDLIAGEFSFTLSRTDASGNALTGGDAYSQTKQNVAGSGSPSTGVDP